MIKIEFNTILFLLACMLSSISCNDIGRIKKEIERMQQRETYLCLSEMDLYTVEDDEKEIRSSFETSLMKLVVYVDSSVCSSCLIKNMYHWYDVIDKVERRYHGKLKVVFVFNPPKKQSRMLEYAYRNSAFSYPIFVDTADVFKRMNFHIPNDNKYHTFLLDKQDRVILVGCPLTNPDVRTMFYELADKHLISNR